MTSDHLRPVLESSRDLHTLFKVAESLSSGQIPPNAATTIRRGRMTALKKDGGGVRGIVVGEVIRRVTARTIAQKLGPAVEMCTSPFQYALSTRAGCECIVHVLQSLTEWDPLATVTSIDGISAYDSISRKAMVEGLTRVPGGGAVLPSVHLFFAEPSSYVWEDENGTVHTILTRRRRRARGSSHAPSLLLGPAPSAGSFSTTMPRSRGDGFLGRHIPCIEA